MKRGVLFILFLAAVVGSYFLLRPTPKIRVTVIEYRQKVLGIDVTVRRWCAKDRVRIEGKAAVGTSTTIVRFDKKEVWILDEKQQVCTVLKIDEMYAEAREGAERFLHDARKDPAQRGQVAALERYLHGDYEVAKSERTVSRMGYNCVAIQARIGRIVRTRALVASDERIPASAPRADEVLAIRVGDSFGEASRHWQRKQNAFGNLVVSAEKTLQLPGMRMPIQTSLDLVEIKVERCSRNLFKVPAGYRTERK